MHPALALLVLVFITYAAAEEVFHGQSIESFSEGASIGFSEADVFSYRPGWKSGLRRCTALNCCSIRLRCCGDYCCKGSKRVCVQKPCSFNTNKINLVDQKNSSNRGDENLKKK